MSTPRIIAVAGQKGGAGKTTLTVHVAEGLRLAGKRVVVVDTDPQGSSLLWREEAAEAGRDAVTVVGAKPSALRSVVAHALEGADVVVIDTPAGISDASGKALREAELVLVPVAPGPADIWALGATHEAIDTVRNLGGDLKAVAVINRAVPRSKFTQALPEIVRASSLPLATAMLCARVAYAEAMAIGQSVLTYEPNGAAADEVRALLAEVMG